MAKAEILRVVVASPGDVQKERDLVAKVVEEVNRDIARDKGLRLEVYRWETDAYPGFHPDGAQGLIDPILKIEDCDILIGIFWKRFGKPVKDAKSGTQHEFNTAYEVWKKKSTPQIMVYFSGKAYTPKSKEETDQWGLVLQFKDDFPKEGLWWPYKNPADFERLLRNHLTQFLRNRNGAYIEPEVSDAVHIPTQTISPLHQVPPSPATFTGRESLIRKLLSAAKKGGVSLHGQGGVGKSALAYKLAEELESEFSDTQIYLDLKGVSGSFLSPAEAMKHVILSFHPESKLPETQAEMEPIYRDTLHGKHFLLLLDNARHAAQVRPLVPSRECALIVTSRQRFTLPGLLRQNVETLPRKDSKKLLLRIAPRIGKEADAIAKLCGDLPLALELAATALDATENLSPKEYAEKLKQKPVKVLAGVPQSIETCINSSYALLDPETQKRWRVLGVFPDTFDALAAAAVWGTAGNAEKDSAKDTLSRLLQYSMLEWNETTDRYRLHDLMHDFAQKQMSEAERGQSSLRHAEHYKNVLSLTNVLYLKGGDSILRGLALFDLEWGNIRTGQAWAATLAVQDRKAARLCSAYPSTGVYCLSLRQHSRDLIAWFEAALSAARLLKDRQAEGDHLGNLGLAYVNLGEPRRAIEFFEQHLKIARELGDRLGEGNALGNLGNAYADLGETRRAIELYELSLKIKREIGNRRGEGNTLGSMGLAYDCLGEPRRAIEFYEQALAIYREIGDLLSEGNSLGNMGIVYGKLGKYRRAIEFFEKHLVTAREIGDRRSEGNALGNMSLALDKLGDRKQAIEHAEAALKIYEQIEDPSAAKVRRQLEEWKK